MKKYSKSKTNQNIFDRNPNFLLNIGIIICPYVTDVLSKSTTDFSIITSGAVNKAKDNKQIYL